MLKPNCGASIQLRMRVFQLVGWLFAAVGALAESAEPSCAGIEALVQRRLPNHANSFEFSINAMETSSAQKDGYTVSTTEDGKIHVQGTSTSAALYG